MVAAAPLLPELEAPPELLLELPPLLELLAEEPAGGGALLLPQAARPALKPMQTRIALKYDVIFPVPPGRRLYSPAGLSH
jgi:hypothetical protein